MRMDLALTKLLFYGFIGTIGALVIYITALALFFNNKLERIKGEELFANLAASDIRRIQQEFSNDDAGELLMLKAIRLLGRGLKVELAIRKVRFDVYTSMMAANLNNF
jgi:hypothetical protein